MNDNVPKPKAHIKAHPLGIILILHLYPTIHTLFYSFDSSHLVDIPTL